MQSIPWETGSMIQIRIYSLRGTDPLQGLGDAMSPFLASLKDMVLPIMVLLQIAGKSPEFLVGHSG